MSNKVSHVPLENSKYKLEYRKQGKGKASFLYIRAHFYTKHSTSYFNLSWVIFFSLKAHSADRNGTENFLLSETENFLLSISTYISFKKIFLTKFFFCLLFVNMVEEIWKYECEIFYKWKGGNPLRKIFCGQERYRTKRCSREKRNLRKFVPYLSWWISSFRL